MIDKLHETIEAILQGVDLSHPEAGTIRWRGIRGRMPSRLGEPEPQVSEDSCVRWKAIGDSTLPARWEYNPKAFPTGFEQPDDDNDLSMVLQGIIDLDDGHDLQQGDLLIDLCALEEVEIEEVDGQTHIAFKWVSSYPSWVYPEFKAKGRIRPYLHDNRPEMAAAEVMERLLEHFGLDEFHSTPILHHVELHTFESLIAAKTSRPPSSSSEIGGHAAAKDVMIVPSPSQHPKSAEEHNHRLYEQFGRDWAALDPDRTLLHLKVDANLQDVKRCLLEASNLAGHGGSIFLNVAHGGIGDAIPRDGHDRYHPISGFDLAPWSSPEHKLQANTSNVSIKDTAGGGTVKVHDPAATAVRDMLTEVGDSFKRNHVKMFKVVACNAGYDDEFGKKLGLLLGVRIDLFKWLVHDGSDAENHPLIWYGSEEVPAGIVRGVLPDADCHYLMTRDAAYSYAAEQGYMY